MKGSDFLSNPNPDCPTARLPCGDKIDIYCDTGYDFGQRNKGTKMASDRINARLTEPLAQHVARVVGHKGLYETPSEYIRALIRRDMESDSYRAYNEIIAGREDLKKGRYFEGTGDFKKDMANLAARAAKK